MRIFYALLILFAVAVLFMLPMTEAIYDFRTDVREDNFTVPTGDISTNATVQLFTDIFEDDVSTIDLFSNLGTDNPTYSSYNATPRNLVVTDLTANTTRILTVFYDIDALRVHPAVHNLLDMIYFMWLLFLVGFPAAAIVAIVTMKE